jgi:hypothetical protein
LPPAPVANDTSVEARLERLKAGLHSRVPANQVSEHLTPEYAEWSDHGDELMWGDLYRRIKKTETGERRTGAGRAKRRPNKRLVR